MALTQDQVARLDAWRKEKGVDKCIACGFDEEMEYASMVAAPIMGVDKHVDLDTNLGRAGVIGMIPAICTNCGYMMMFQPIIVGFMAEESGD